MTPLEERADQILRGLWKRPRLFWAFLEKLAKVKPVLGPWTEANGGRHMVRYDAWGRMHATVVPLGKVDKDGGHWKWRVLDGSSKMNVRASGERNALELAMADADAWMFSDSYVLIEGGG